MVRKRGRQPPPPSTWTYEVPGEGGARTQGVISGCHGSALPRGNFPELPPPPGPRQAVRDGRGCPGLGPGRLPAWQEGWDG